ncbi:tetratricopeptide repeat protein [Capilliphycus salinus ALCB114379]|uniref:tetratricopeptide repeat protein n=1 Tax=Capilliphycus salinus TaxID=2768948 RepID=UPI0039A6D236
MVDKRRGFIGVILVLSVIAFVGFSMGPIIGSIVGANRSNSQTTPSPAQTAQARQADLEAQARGYELVLQREPDNETALRGFLEANLELISMGQGEVGAVVEPLQKLSQMYPEKFEYSILLAQSQQYTGDLEGAAQTYRKILTQQPGQIQALQGLVNLLLAQKRPEAAIGLLQDTIKAAPQANQAQPGSIDETSVQLILGQVYAEQKRYDEAIAIYDEAIRNNQEDFRPVLAKALVLKDQGNLEEAEPLFAKASDMAPAPYKDQIQQAAGMVTTPPQSVEGAASPTTEETPSTPEPEAVENTEEVPEPAN